MPLARYQIRNEYGLADPEMYRAALESDDPEAILEGVAMAGLVGVLRQIGDLAEFAAAIFNDLHKEVMVTAARGHDLMIRVEQLEAEFPSIEKEVLSQTDHSKFFYDAGVEWHPNLRMQLNLIARGDLPRCIMDCYEECRGPPQFFPLDKFDVAGAGACLKRYSNPSLFKSETASAETARVGRRKDKKSRKGKRSRVHRRDEGPADITAVLHAKLHQAFHEELIQSDHSDPACVVKLKSRELSGSLHDSNSGRSYMEMFLEGASTQNNAVPEISTDVLPSRTCLGTSSESDTEIPEADLRRAAKKLCQDKDAETSLVGEVVRTPSVNLSSYQILEKDIEMMPESTADDGADIRKSTCHLDEIYSEYMRGWGGEYKDGHTAIGSNAELDKDDMHRNEAGILTASKYWTDIDASEEQTDTHESSDCQPIEGRSVLDDDNTSHKKGSSSLSYIDNMSPSADNESPYAEAAKLMPPIQTYEAETQNESFAQPLVDKECIRHESVGKDEYNVSDPEEAYCSSQLAYKNHPAIQSSSMHVASSVSCQLDRTFEHVNIGTDKLSTNKMVMSQIDSSTVFDVHPEVRDGANPSHSSAIHREDKLDGPDSQELSKSLQQKWYPDMAPQEKETVQKSSVNEVPPTDVAEDIPPENLPNEGIIYPQPLISALEESLPSSALQDKEDGDVSYPQPPLAQEESLPSSALQDKEDWDVSYPQPPLAQEESLPGSAVNNAGRQIDISLHPLGSEVETPYKIDGLTSVDEMKSSEYKPYQDAEAGAEVCDGSQPTEPRPEGKTRVIDTPQTASTGKKQFSYASHDESSVGDDAEQRNPYPDEEANSNQVSASAGADAGRVGQFSDEEATLNPLPGETNYIECGEISYKENEVEGYSCSPELQSDYLVNDLKLGEEYFYEEDFAMSHPKATCAGDDDIPSSDQSQEGEGFGGTGSSEDYLHREAQVQKSQFETTSTDPDFVVLVSVSYDHSSHDMLDNDGNSSITDPTGNTAGDLTPHSTSSKLSDSESEIIHTDQSSLSENTEHVLSSNTSLLPEHATSSEQSPDLCAYQVEHQQATETPPEPENLNDFSEPSSKDSSVGGQLPEFSLPLPSEEIHLSKQAVNLDAGLPSFGISSETTVASLAETLPLPPPPPVQWLGRAQSFAPVSKTESAGTVIAPSLATSTYVDGVTHCSFTTSENMASGADKSVIPIMPTTVNNTIAQQDSVASAKVQSENSSTELGIPRGSENLMPSEMVLIQTPNQSEADVGSGAKVSQSRSANSVEHEDRSNVTTATLPQLKKVEEQFHQAVLHGSEGEEAQGLQHSGNALSGSTGDKSWPTQVQKENAHPRVQPSRPQNFLVDALAALDRSKLKRVSERNLPPLAPKVDERDSLLEQIRNKSFNLKPATVSKPSVHQAAPLTNLKIAAILEKANTIRQAMAGTKEDEDSDSWSDA